MQSINNFHCISGRIPAGLVRRQPSAGLWLGRLHPQALVGQQEETRGNELTITPFSLRLKNVSLSVDRSSRPRRRDLRRGLVSRRPARRVCGKGHVAQTVAEMKGLKCINYDIKSCLEVILSALYSWDIGITHIN